MKVLRLPLLGAAKADQFGTQMVVQWEIAYGEVQFLTQDKDG